MRNTLNDVIALIENVIVTGKNRDWNAVENTVDELATTICGFKNMVSDSAWYNVYRKVLNSVNYVLNYNNKMENLSEDECYIVYLQHLMNRLKVLNEIKYNNVWC